MPPAAHQTSRRRLLADRLATWVVGAGGLAVIVSVVGILVFIVAEVAPLLRGATVEVSEPISLPGADLRAAVVDEYRERIVGVDRSGELVIVAAASGEVLERRPLLSALAPRAHAQAVDAAGGSTGAPADFAGESPASETAPPPGLVGARREPGGTILSIATDDGRVIAVPIDFEVRFDESTRVVEAMIGTPVVFESEQRIAVTRWAVALEPSGPGLAAIATDGDSVDLVRREARENLMTGEVTETFDHQQIESPVELTSLVVDAARRNLYGGGRDGSVLWWNLAEDQSRPDVASAGSAAITKLSLLIGDRSLVVGDAEGALSVWFQVRQEDQSFHLTEVRRFPSLPTAVVDVTPSARNKGFVALAADGALGLYYSTNERTLWAGPSGVAQASSVVLAPKADGAFVTGPGGLVRVDIDNPHPEATWRSFFGKIWYEGYDGPEHVWQSTGGTDDFEAKLGLTPLIVGTLKGTVFSLMLAIPLGILGAMYTSQFMHPRYQGVVKPTVEIMAALPTVVLGFLAGLWLAPLVERNFPGIVTMFVLVPLAVIGAGALWHTLPRRIRGRYPAGTEGMLFIGVVALAGWASLALSGTVETVLFGGNFPQFLRDATGLTYDQRNAVVVGLAMGFAVIPIIFAISEDAFSNVPRNLVAGSLALGANRWQTVTRVVLPTASPGIFSAVMIGFGRAVGETMIVLMATGNTPIMSMSPFNGFRTLSANIAVEIPEAPVDSTLYRTLFLAALVLFVLTFGINTIAELVRQRLRERYSRL